MVPWEWNSRDQGFLSVLLTVGHPASGTVPSPEYLVNELTVKAACSLFIVRHVQPTSSLQRSFHSLYFCVWTSQQKSTCSAKVPVSKVEEHATWHFCARTQHPTLRRWGHTSANTWLGSIMTAGSLNWQETASPSGDSFQLKRGHQCALIPFPSEKSAGKGVKRKLATVW